MLQQVLEMSRLESEQSNQANAAQEVPIAVTTPSEPPVSTSPNQVEEVAQKPAKPDPKIAPPIPQKSQAPTIAQKPDPIS